MAIRGKRPRITMLRPLKGRKHPGSSTEPMPDGVPEPPANFTPEHRALWDRYVAPAFWLTRIDEPKSLMFVYLLHDFLSGPTKMSMARRNELRQLGSELGFDPVARARMGNDSVNAFDKYI